MLDGFSGAQPARLGDDRDTASGLVDNGLDDVPALSTGHRGELRRGTAGHHPVDAGVDGAVDQATEGVGVDPSVRGERGQQGGENAGDRGHGGFRLPFWKRAKEKSWAGRADHPGQPAVDTAVSGVACCRSVASRLCTSWAAFRPVYTAVSV